MNWPSSGRAVAAIKRIRSRGQSAYALGSDAGTAVGTEADGGAHLRSEQSLERRAAGANTLYIADLGYFSLPRFVAERQREATRSVGCKQAPPCSRQRASACVGVGAAPRGGSAQGTDGAGGARKLHPMRLLLLRVPKRSVTSGARTYWRMRGGGTDGLGRDVVAGRLDRPGHRCAAKRCALRRP